jgi:hypothetical protein
LTLTGETTYALCPPLAPPVIADAPLCHLATRFLPKVSLSPPVSSPSPIPIKVEGAACRHRRVRTTTVEGGRPHRALRVHLGENLAHHLTAICASRPRAPFVLPDLTTLFFLAFLSLSPPLVYLTCSDRIGSHGFIVVVCAKCGTVPTRRH